MNTQEATTQPITRNQFSWGRLAWLLIIAGIIISLDQYTKQLVVSNIPFLDTWLPEGLAQFSDWFRIVHWHNSGAAFGIFQNGNLIFLIMGIVATAFILFLFPTVNRHEWALSTAMILQLGGAVGNLIDRIRFGHVIDFISILRLPVFNIADTSIALGVVILFLDVLWAERQERRAKGSLTQHPSTIAGENE